LKKKILKLRKQGKTYKEICEILHCTKSTISWHCCDELRKREIFKKRNARRNKARHELKIKHGGKCYLCGYNKCLRALEFHHKDPKLKEDTVSNVIRSNGVQAAAEESNKCVLLCGNCHC